MTDKSELLVKMTRALEHLRGQGNVLNELKEAATTLGLRVLADRLSGVRTNIYNVRQELVDLERSWCAPTRPRPNEIVGKLQELRKLCTYETASFGFPSEKVNSNPYLAPQQVGVPIDEFIKERTRLHRESWILPTIDELIGLLNAEDTSP